MAPAPRHPYPEVLIDKIGERMAFKKSGAQLYETFIAKCESVLPHGSFGFLREIQDDEVKHFKLLKDALETLGGDAQAGLSDPNITPAQNVELNQIVSDPRTDIAQSALAMLTAKVVDNDRSLMLVNLAKRSGQEELAEKLQEARASEDRHLSQIRSWLTILIYK